MNSLDAWVGSHLLPSILLSIAFCIFQNFGLWMNRPADGWEGCVRGKDNVRHLHLPSHGLCPLVDVCSRVFLWPAGRNWIIVIVQRKKETFIEWWGETQLGTHSMSFLTEPSRSSRSLIAKKLPLVLWNSCV